MALNAYLTLKGETQGDIKGSVTQAGREDSIMVFAVDHQIVSPRDAASGLPTGKRMHKPLVITKEVDKSSPLLYSMLVHNENIPSFKLDFWRPSRTGKEEQFYSVELSNASIASMDFTVLSNKEPETMRIPEYEKIAFCYQKITWTWHDGGIAAEDDWEAPVA
jgi:type VI secretion system secreted protein Hcp